MANTPRVLAALCALTSASAALPQDFLTDVPVPIPPKAEITFLTDVDALAPDDVWAVGYYESCWSCVPFGIQSLSLTMHYDGSAWSIVPSPSPVDVSGDRVVRLDAVDAVSSNLAFAAGSYTNGSAQSTDTFVLKWDGSSWVQLISPGVSAFGAQGFLFEAVHALSATDVWFGGQFASGPCSDPCPTMVRYDGQEFTTHYLPQTPGSLAPHRVRAIDSLAPNDIWAVGASGGVVAPAIGRTYVARWDGTSWELVQPPVYGSDENLVDVLALAADDVWACGYFDGIGPGGVWGTWPLFIHWDGSSWTSYPSPTFASALVANAPNDIYGLGAYGLVHWDGTAWSLVDSIQWPMSGFSNFYGLSKVSDGRMVGVGFDSFGPGDGEPRVVEAIASVGIVDLGFGLAGVSGVPELSVTGTVQPGSPLLLSLAGAAPSATAFLVLGNTVEHLAAFGGTLVPSLDTFVVLATDATGEIDLGPVSLPSGFGIYLQYWIMDPAAGPSGLAASNALAVGLP